ncbi:unnamed protein product [Rotaria sp. Silwood2]|nr:unnamed protein product [Rotaria sp. Silwood2]CAF2524488.1 unnamed protein product [Rotaria sp. Silwood2]CAF2947089.1 unnamed protein product [Rotaria sp. Silwood2]CAF4031150.1 unnamed protein product [Rotaria sp. Silwood2]CAF4052601.1 unnamed protein product [Rotaria sp. Silwood2]
MGTIIDDKIESGLCHIGDQCIIMPNRTRIEIRNIYCNNIDADSANYGEDIGILEHELTMRPGYSAILHIHVAVATVQLKKIFKLINHKTGEIIEENSRFIKRDQVAIAIFKLSQVDQVICMKPFKCYPQLGRFTLHREGYTIVVGKFLQFIR